MIRQAAFGGTDRLLKGGLHCHTTRSDGAGAPDEVIRLYKASGYDFLSITDHNLYNYANFAPDTDITILPGMERDVRLCEKGVHCFHTVCIGPEQGAKNGYAQDQRFEGRALVKDQFAFQRLLDEVHAHGNLTIYCHPEWSHTPACEFDRLTGNFALEIYNSECAIVHDLDTNAACWDTLLAAGQRIFGVAVDDGHAMSSHCNGWVRVRAQNSVADILSALESGAFYSSCGPEIDDFYVEDGTAVLKCSPVVSAGVRMTYTPTRLKRSAKADLTEVTFKIPPHATYVRGVVQDASGRRAWTNPIFL